MNEAYRTIRRHTRTHKGLELFRNFFRVLIANQTEGNFRRGLGGNDRFGALSRIAADDAINIASRTRLDLLDQQPVALACRMFQPDLCQKIGHIQLFPLVKNLGRNFLHAVIKMRHRHPPVFVMQIGNDLGQNPHRILCRPAKQARMQIPIRTGDDDLFIDQTPQRGGDRRCARIPHAGIANERHIRRKLCLMRLDKGRQIGRTALLFAFNQNRQSQRQMTRHSLIGPTGFDEGHDLPLVVTGPACGNGFAPVRQNNHARLKGRRVPLIERIDRLHIIMTIKQRFFLGLPVRMTKHDRMACGVADLGFEPQSRHFVFQPGRCRHAMGRIDRIGGNGGNFQPVKQALQRRIKILIDFFQYGIKRCHRVWSSFYFQCQKLSLFITTRCIKPDGQISLRTSGKNVHFRARCWLNSLIGDAGWPMMFFCP